MYKRIQVSYYYVVTPLRHHWAQEKKLALFDLMGYQESKYSVLL